MKKTICLLLVVLLTISTLLIFTSCVDDPDDSKTNDNKIYLTLDNYDQYIKVSARFYGEGMHWNSFFSRYDYNYIVASAEISSTHPSIKFYGCKVEIKISGEYRTSSLNQVNPVLEISLSLGGTGSDYKQYTAGNGRDIKGHGYSVVSVSGYVIVE